MTRSKRAAALLVACALSSVVAAAATGRAAFLVVAFLSLLPAASSLGRAGRLASSLQAMARTSVRVVAWGATIRHGGSADFRLDRVRPFGAGLLIHLASPGESPT